MKHPKILLKAPIMHSLPETNPVIQLLKTIIQHLKQALAEMKHLTKTPTQANTKKIRG